MEIRRCPFCAGKKETSALVRYHDFRWCKAEHQEKELFAMLILEGMQAGVSWEVILNKEENFRKAFDGFDPNVVTEYGEEKIQALLQDKGIVRNRKKIEAAVQNAKAFLKVQERYQSFDRFIWSFTDGKTIDHLPKKETEIPARNELSERVSEELKRFGFRFVGPTIVYSYLQGIGVFNDHLISCDFRK